MKVTYTIHALNRYHERFPNCPITIYQACEESIPYGRQTNSTKVTIHPTHKIIFIIDKLTEAPILKTILTQQLYLANAQANTHAWQHTHTPTNPTHIIRPPEPDHKKEREQEYKREIQEKHQKKQEIETQLIKQATEYARLKNYAPWHKDLQEEAKAKYGISRNNLDNYFKPQYYRECSHYHLFRTEAQNA
jgi:hypothetical protein